jgi:hypothetical protein
MFIDSLPAVIAEPFAFLIFCGDRLIHGLLGGGDLLRRDRVV